MMVLQKVFINIQSCLCMYMYTSDLFGLIRRGEILSEHIVLHIDLWKRLWACKEVKYLYRHFNS